MKEGKKNGVNEQNYYATTIELDKLKVSGVRKKKRKKKNASVNGRESLHLFHFIFIPLLFLQTFFFFFLFFFTSLSPKFQLKSFYLEMARNAQNPRTHTFA